MATTLFHFLFLYTFLNLYPLFLFIAMATAPQNAMRTLRQLSMLATGGAAFYLVSDGGDLEVLRARSSTARTTLDERLMAVFGVEETNFLREGLDNIYAALPEIPKPKTKPTPMEQVQVQREEEPQVYRKGGVLCHTCSGPRLWYLADKFRFKRRITPYPDPPRDGDGNMAPQ